MLGLLRRPRPRRTRAEAGRCTRAEIGIALIATGCLLLPARGVCAQGDQRNTFEATFYTGLSVDAFAAGDLNRYLNPNSSGRIRTRVVGGVDFAYRLIGKAGDGLQAWIYGETVHGVRSTDVNCMADSTLAVCEQNPFDPINAPDRFLAIVRNATSLEAFAGVRLEFLRVQLGDVHEARAYFKGQIGFLSVDGGGGDVADAHHVAIGVTLVSDGGFQDSYLEAGFGRTDLFQERPGRRFKFDGLLSWKVNFLSDKLGIFPFAQITVDADFADGPDSIQSYFGLDLDMRCLLGGIAGATNCAKP